jgi:polar amino acid transport system substrate-binding protein
MKLTSILIVGPLVALLGACASAEKGDRLAVCIGRNIMEQKAHPSEFEHEILSSFAQANGLELDINWDAPLFFTRPLNTLPEVFEDGGCEVYAATITVTPERATVVDFSDPYFPVRGLLVSLQGRGFRSPEELEGKKILVPEESYLEAVLKEKAPGAEVVYLDGIDLDKVIAMLKTGQADATIIDSWMVAALVWDNSELEVTLSLTETDYFAFALPKGSPLKAKLDSHLQDMKQDGRFYRALSANFGPEVAEMVAEELGARQAAKQ